jgi:hypothetical protein
MSAEMASSTSDVTIYIPLLNEGTMVARPTRGVKLSENVYRVLATPEYDPNDEAWEFPPESIVECHLENRSSHEVLVATKRVSVM